MIDRIPTSRLDRLGSFDLYRTFVSVGAVRFGEAVDPTLVQALLQSASRAFALPKKHLDAYRRVGTMSGYTPAGIEGVRGKRGDTAREFWDLLSPELYEPFFPSKVPELRSQALELFQLLESLTLRLLHHLDLVRPSHEEQLQDITRGGNHALRLNHYFPSPSGEVLFPRHIDFGLLTLYIGGAEPGLEFRQDGEWRDLHNPPGSVVASVNSTIRQYEPAFRPLRHRVTSRGTERFSVVFFTEPRCDIVLPNGVRSQDHLARLTSFVRQE